MRCEPQRTSRGLLRANRAVAGAAAVAIMVTAGACRAEAAGGSAGLGVSDAAASQVQVPATIAVTPMGPLTALNLGGQSMTCVQSPLAIDAAGHAGVLAPQVGITIIRGSAAPTPSMSWVVVPAGRLSDGNGNGNTAAITICTPSR